MVYFVISALKKKNGICYCSSFSIVFVFYYYYFVSKHIIEKRVLISTFFDFHTHKLRQTVLDERKKHEFKGKMKKIKEWSILFSLIIKNKHFDFIILILFL